MTSSQPVRVAVVGAGGMARAHIRWMLKQRDTTQVVALCEPSAASYDAAAVTFAEAGAPVPPNEPDLEKLLADAEGRIDVALIVTPHVYHYAQASMCMEAGLDVLLEKPMVMNAGEAERLIATRDRTGRLLVVAFNGSMSPEVRAAVSMLRAGELGEMLAISATVWQDWKQHTANTWRQDPAIAGGGFLFDTGAHMLNTVVDLAGEGFAEVSAVLDNRGTPVDINGVVMGRTRSGMMVTMHGCGDASTGGTDVRVFCTDGVIRTGVWGGIFELQRKGEDSLKPVDVPPALGTWQQFLAVRAGRLQNPGPPEVGLRMARLWDAIQESAARGGAPITLTHE